MWKKLLILNLAILLLLSSLPMVASAETAEAAEPQVATQSTDDAFTRGSFAQFLVDDVLGIDLTNYTPGSGISFNDVPSSHANYKAISFCAEQGWMGADNGTNFAPGSTVKRREAAVILLNYLGGSPDSSGAWLHDMDQTAADYKACSFAVTYGYLHAEADLFRPDNNLLAGDIVVSQIPTRVFYKGEFDIKVEAGADSFNAEQIKYSELTDASGKSLGLSDTDDYFSNSNGMSMNICTNSGDDGSYLWLEADNAQPGDTCWLMFYPNNGTNYMNAKKYVLTATATLPEWGVYTSATASRETYIKNAENSVTLNTAIDNIAYIVPTDDATTITAASCGSNDLTVEVTAGGKAVKVTGNGNTNGYLVNITYGNNQTKTVSLNYNNTTELSLGWSNSISVGLGETTSYQMTIGNRRVWADQFTFALSSSLTGATVSAVGGYATLSMSSNATIDTQGTLTATKGDASFTCNITVGYPTLGIYKDTTRSAANLLGVAEEMTWNLNNANAPTTVYLIPNEDYSIRYMGSYYSENASVRNDTVNGYIVASVTDVSEAGMVRVGGELQNNTNGWNKSFYHELTWEKPEVADEPDTTHLFAGSPSKTTLTMYTTNSDRQHGLTYYVQGKDGKLEEKWADRTFDLELKSDDPSYSIGTAYWNGYGNMQIQNAAPGTGTLIAKKGNIRRTLKVVIKRKTMEIYSDPDGAANHYIGREVYFEGTGSTFYFVPDPSLNTTITSVEQMNSIVTGDNGWEIWDGLDSEIVENGKALKVTVKQSYLNNPDPERYVSFHINLANGSSPEGTITLIPGTLFTNEFIWASRKNATKLRTWNGTTLDYTYKVTVKDGNGKIIPSRWIDDDYLMIDTRNVGKGNELKYTVTATKGSATYKTIETTMYIPEYSTYTGTYTDDPTTTFSSAVGQPVTYNDENRTFYYYGVTVSTDLLSFVEDECSTTNPNIEIEFDDYRTWTVAGFGTYPYMSGNKCMKLTLKEGVNTPQVAIVSAAQQTYRDVGDGGKFTNYFLVILVPEWMKDGYQQSQGNRNGMSWELEDGTLAISGNSVEAYTSTLEFENRRDEITKLELDSRTGEIGAGAFKGLDHLESVTIPDNTQVIGKNAFEGCGNLDSVTIPGNVEKIDNSAFDNTADDLTIHGDAGDTFAETYAMLNDIDYESKSGTAEGSSLSIDIGKTVTADNRVAVAAVIDNGGSTKAKGTAIAAIYYQGKLIATEIIDSETATGKQDRLVMQLPYLQNLDADKLDIQILYLGSNNAPLTKAATQEAEGQPAMFSARTAATQISASANSPATVTPTDGKFSINYTDVTSGEYVLMAIKSGTSITNLTEENLLYVQQQSATGTTVSFSNFGLKSNEDADFYIGTKKIATYTAAAKTSKTVTVSATGATYGEAVKVTASSDVANAIYSYRYTNNKGYDSDKMPTDAGTYTVTATLVSDDYTGSGTASFTISPKNLSKCTVLEMQSVIDTGKAQKPTVTVMDSFSKLTSGTDFTAEYKNNSAVGTASVTITGKGNYTGTATAEFKILKNENPEPVNPGTPGGGSDITEDENTVTLPNGNTVTTETTEDGELTISVTDENGKTVANISLPAEPGEGGDFTDVPENSWYEEAVQSAVGYGLFSGVSDTTFEPKSGMTRGMLAQVLYNLCGQTNYGESGTFTDSTGWFEKAVNWAAAAGVASGNGDGTFEPNEEITREQLVMMLYNFCNVIGAENNRRTSLATYPDGKNVSSWASEAMQWAVANGIVSGSKEGDKLYLNPKATATRAEVASIMVKFVEYLK